MKKSLQITQTAVLTAMLILLQSVTKAGGQLITGSCVNVVLAVAVLFSGLWSGVAVAVISPFFAFALGVGPQLFPIVPAIAVGNVVYVLILHFLLSKKSLSLWKQGIYLLLAAAGKTGSCLYYDVFLAAADHCADWWRCCAADHTHSAQSI